MFRKNTKHQQPALIPYGRDVSAASELPEKQRKRLENSWAGAFYKEFFSRIDEQSFAVLYSERLLRSFEEITSKQRIFEANLSPKYPVPCNDIRAKASITLLANMLATKMEMAFMKCMSTRWKDFGLYCVHGCVHTEAFRRKSCLAISLSLSLFTMSVVAARLCFMPCLLFS
jgi:hypothetical protein